MCYHPPPSSSPSRGEEEPQQEAPKGGNVSLHLRAVVRLRQQSARGKRSKCAAQTDRLRQLPDSESHQKAKRHESFRAPGAYGLGLGLGLEMHAGRAGVG